MITFIEDKGIAILAGLGALLLIFTVLRDAFEVIILPRRVTRRYRLTAWIYRITWTPWSAIAQRIRDTARRESFLGFYGPFGLLLLLFVWAIGLIFGFALLQWASGSALTAPEGSPNFGTDLYMSGTTFFTLGLGDVVPHVGLARAITVIEAGTGFGILALVIGYLPVLYQAFSRREVNISLLDARAGSPPSAGELLRRYGKNRNVEALNQFLYEWERWSAELMESHLSYPSLAYFRSQHDNQSWLAAMTMILDACALAMVGIDGVPTQQARLTFAMARHAAVDLAQIFGTTPHACKDDRLPPADLAKLRAMLTEAGVPLRDESAANKELARWREMYEPYVNGLSDKLLIELPLWMPREGTQDDWLSSA
jgi:hypothetical protein